MKYLFTWQKIVLGVVAVTSTISGFVMGGVVDAAMALIIDSLIVWGLFRLVNRFFIKKHLGVTPNPNIQESKSITKPGLRWFTTPILLIGGFVVVALIIGGLYWNKTQAEVARKNLIDTQQRAILEKKAKENETYRKFLFEEAMLNVRYLGRGTEIAINVDAYKCPEQEEFDRLIKSFDGSTQDVQRANTLYPTCGYTDASAQDFFLSKLNEDISGIFALLTPIENLDKKALAQQVADDWREIARQKNEEYGQYRQLMDSRKFLWSLYLINKQNNSLNSNGMITEMNNYSKKISDYTAKQQEVKTNIDNLLMKRGDAIAQFQVGVVLPNNSNANMNSNAAPIDTSLD